MSSRLRAPSVLPRRLGRAFLPLIGLGVAVAVWGAAVAFLAEPGTLVARFAPLKALGSVPAFLSEESGVTHVAATLKRLCVSLGIAVTLGTVGGVAVGVWEPLERATSAVSQFLRMVSPLAWTPIAIILLGIGDTPVYFLVAVAAVWPVLLSTSAGVHALDKGWIEVAHSLGATWWEMVRTVVIPGIRAHIATGFRVALGVAWVVIVPGEMLGVDSGLGYAILDARDRLAYSEMMGIILVIGAIGFILDRAFQYVVAGTRTAGPIRGSSPITSRLGRRRRVELVPR